MNNFNHLILIFLSLFIISCSESVDINNILPLASAGEDIEINEQTEITITGVGSDEDGIVSNITWRQLEGSEIVIQDNSNSSITFTTPTVTAVETLIFEIIVTDDSGESKTDKVSIIVNPVNAIPVASAGNDFIAHEQTQVTLAGSDSTDSDGDIQYAWTQISAGTTVELVNPDSEFPSFTAPASSSDEPLTFKLTVTDNENATAEDEITVTINPNSAPVSSDLTISTFINIPVIEDTVPVVNDDNLALTYLIVNNPTIGNITHFDTTTGDFSYAPVGATGTDQFTVTARDYLGELAQSTVTITIDSVSLEEKDTSNDDQTSAISIFQNSSITASLSDSTDHDWFTYTAFIDGSVKISIDLPTSSVENTFDITIIDENDQILAEYTTKEDVVFYQSVSQGQLFFIQVTSGNNLDTSLYSLTLENYDSVQATLSWEKPLLNEDGSSLIDLVRYHIYHDTDESGNLDQQIVIEDELLSSYVIKHLRPGKLYSFSMTAINSLNIESSFSDIASKQF